MFGFGNEGANARKLDIPNYLGESKFKSGIRSDCTIG